LRTADFDFPLPPELIAQIPEQQRDLARMLVLRRATEAIEHRRIQDLPGFLESGDLLVLNNSRVIPARLRGANDRSGGEFEVLLLEENAVNDWWVMLRPGKRARIGTRIRFRALRATVSELLATVEEVNEEGHRRLRFEGGVNVQEVLPIFGEVPLPPYIDRSGPSISDADRERYQTVYARAPGSVAAPTAGLHFTEALLENLRSMGVAVCFVTLHVGLGTFAPVKSETLAGHHMHEERFTLSEETAATILKTKRAGGRVVAVGTTSVRVLESVAAEHNGTLAATSGRTRIFIYPPYRFLIVDGLLTNFHLPRSTLLMLVSAFAAPGEDRGRERILGLYSEAVEKKYRFFSYGDAMLLL
jgi:S-adenosylmethionine:tRNA ribosyltransferase-isomerase